MVKIYELSFPEYTGDMCGEYMLKIVVAI